MEELEQEALELLKNRDFDKAASAYVQLAVAHPDDEKYLITAANCYDNAGDKKIALSLYKKALVINPCSVPACLNMSTIYYELQRFDKSLQFAQKVLEIDDKNFAALLNMGNACYAQGKFDEALRFYEKVYEINPNSYNAILNLANTSYNLGQFVRAISYAKTAIEKRPTSPEPYIVAGNSYIEIFKNDEASSCLKKASELAPASEFLCNSIANLFQKMKNWKQCLHYAWKAFTLKGANVTIDDHINFAYFLYEAQEEENNAELVEKYLSLWEEAFAENPVVRHVCAALRNTQDVSLMDLTYVKNLFDGFAPSFDEILGELEYKVPDLIAEELKNHLKTKLFKKRRILDLGCGTGLCAQALKAYFPNEEFYGVDISDRMLYEAEKKGIYKQLVATDILNFLANNETLFHAVVAGDVLTYTGDLKPLFRELVAAVKFQGFFAFSISKNTFNTNDYFLTPSGRFVHSLQYVLRLLNYCGFKKLSVNETVLRHEGDKEVVGYIIVAQKEIEVVFE